MSSKREDERNEKIIRGLMKLPPNRRCINCNSLGPQYVCTNFWTFVCTTCSGIHREFTHRVKSVSMAKFTFQEVDALQKGGNQRARELFLNAWDLHRDKLPDNSNLAKVREFIKNVYVDKIYALEKSSDRPPRGPQSLRTKDDETRRASSYHSYSQSPPYDFQYEERRYGKHGPALTRKPGSDRGPYEGKLASFLSPDHSSYRANDDRFANDESHHRASDFSFSAGGDPFRLDVLSPSSLRFSDIASGPERPAEILHQKSPSLSSLPRSSVSGTFDGVDLFSAHFAPPKVTSTPPSASTFPEQQPAQNPQASSLDLFAVVSQQQSTEPSAGKTSEVVMEDNGGWATFDTPEKMVPLSTKTTAPATASSPDGHNFQKFKPFSLDQDFYQNSEGHEPSASTLSFQNESPQNVEATANNSHFWTAFEDSGEQLHIQKVESNRQAAVSDVDNSLGVGAHEVLKNGDNARTAEGTYCAPSSLSSHFSMPLNDFPIVPAVDAATPSLATESKPINPFDVRYDSDIESGNSFWDMRSLQDALSNNEMPTFCVDGENESWFAQDAVPFDPPIGSLAFISGQAPNVQIPNIHAQGPVASVGGNPFA